LKAQIVKSLQSADRKQPSVETKTVEKFVLKDGQLARAEKLVEQIKAASDKYLALKEIFEERDRTLGEAAHELAQAILSTRNTHATMTPRVDRQVPVSPHVRRAVPAATASRPAHVVSPSSNGDLSSAEHRVLDAVAWWTAANITDPTRLQVAMVARYTVNGHFNNLVGGLRTKGLVDYPSSGGVMLTDSGSALANRPDSELTRDELIARVLQVLRGEPIRRIFSAVVEANRDLSREELAGLTNYTVNGHFNNLVGSLRSLGVIEYPHQGGVRLAEMFNALP
jgi:hypothetical protein